MTRRAIVLTCSLAAACLAPLGSTLAQASTPATRRALAQDPRRVSLERLHKNVEIELKDSRLEDVFVFITQYSDLDLEPLWLTDQGAITGLDKETRISVKVRNETVLSLLERVLERASTPLDQATWQLTPSGGVQVGPKSRLNRAATVKIYDIQDLTFAVPDFVDVPELDLDTVLQQGSQRGGGGGGGLFNDPAMQTLGEREEDSAQRIVDILLQTVEPEQWIQNGGDGASLQYLHGNLIIRAPDYIHRQIAGYPFWPGYSGTPSHAGRYVNVSGQTSASSPVRFESQPVTGTGGAPQP